MKQRRPMTLYRYLAYNSFKDGAFVEAQTRALVAALYTVYLQERSSLSDPGSGMYGHDGQMTHEAFWRSQRLSGSL